MKNESHMADLKPTPTTNTFLRCPFVLVLWVMAISSSSAHAMPALPANQTTCCIDWLRYVWIRFVSVKTAFEVVGKKTDLFDVRDLNEPVDSVEFKAKAELN